MPEIYRGTSDLVELRVYRDGVQVAADALPTVTVTRNGTVVATGTATADGLPPRYTFRLGLGLTNTEGSLRVDWTYTLDGATGTKSEVVEVVTPYVTIDEIREAYPQLANKSYDELRDMERRVRTTINSYTNQSFGSVTGTVRVYGMDRDILPLGRRIYRLDSIAVNGTPVDLAAVPITINESGYAILHSRQHLTSDIKKDIVFPNISNQYFRYSTVYEITGAFGWESVPADINLAAKMLIGDYFCNDSNWRNKGISSVRAADWRFEFGDQAFAGTGNLDVDRILDAYRPFDMVII